MALLEFKLEIRYTGIAAIQLRLTQSIRLDFISIWTVKLQ
jgi:hypothetical protein